MRTTFIPFSISVFGLVVLSLAVSRGDEGNRIVGGSEVDPHSIPWQVALTQRNSRRPFCGGTILSATKILTAAHCYTSPSSVQVVVGEHKLLSMTDGVRHNVESFKKHPGYNPRTVDNDYAIITLEKPIELGDKAKAACLPKSEDDPKLREGQKLTVSGWGRLSENSGPPTVLHGAKVPFVPNATCKRVYRSLTRNMMCAGYANGQIDSCSGDSGGPLTVGNTVLGVVSWGKGCAKPGFPGVYAKVSEQLQWLKAQGVTNACEGSGADRPTTTTPTPANPSPTKQCINKRGRRWCQRYANRYCGRNSSSGRYVTYRCPKTCGINQAQFSNMFGGESCVCFDKANNCPRYAQYCVGYTVMFRGKRQPLSDVCPATCNKC